MLLRQCPAPRPVKTADQNATTSCPCTAHLPVTNACPAPPTHLVKCNLPDRHLIRHHVARTLGNLGLAARLQQCGHATLISTTPPLQQRSKPTPPSAPHRFPRADPAGLHLGQSNNLALLQPRLPCPLPLTWLASITPRSAARCSCHWWPSGSSAAATAGRAAARSALPPLPRDRRCEGGRQGGGGKCRLLLAHWLVWWYTSCQRLPRPTYNHQTNRPAHLQAVLQRSPAAATPAQPSPAPAAPAHPSKLHQE